MDELVSIIVPVYNTEQYLPECIESMIKQTYNKLEILLINDGSTDGSLSVCREYAEKDSRIKVFDCCSRGVVETRKKGIEEATGGFMTFVDSDDTVKEDYIETLVKELGDSQLVTSCLLHGVSVMKDGIEPGRYTINNDSPVIRNMICMEDKITRGMTGYMCGKLFISSKAKGLLKEIDSDIYIYEDSDFVYKYILQCESVRVTGYCGYNYRVNSNSLYNTYHEDILISCNKLYLSLKKTFDSCPYKETLHEQLELYLLYMLRESLDFMGISKNNRPIRYVIPYCEKLKDKKVVVYGGGNVGRDYVRYIINKNVCKELLWVDKNWKNIESCGNMVAVSSDHIKNYQYDYIIIAVKNDLMAESIRLDLENSGINPDKVIWEEPMDIAFV